MENTNTNATIYLKDLFFSIVYRWKRILTVGVIFAVIFALLSWVTSISGSITAEKDAIVQHQYQREENILRSKIDVLTAGIKTQQDYLTDSILMKLDPRAYYEIALTVYVDTNYQILPEMSYQTPDMTATVINSYVNLLESRNALLSLSDTLGTKPDYLADVLQIQADTVNQTILINAQYVDEAGAKDFANAVLNYLSTLHDQIEESVAEHTCTVLSRDIYKEESIDIFNKQSAQLDALDLLEEDLDATELEIAKLKPPVTSTTPYTVKDAVLPAVIGGIVGVFVTMLMIVLAFLTDPKVYSVRTARDRTNIKILSCARSDRKLLPDILWLRMREGRVNATLEQQYPLLAANIRNRCEDGQTLLISGSADPALVEQTANYLRAALPEIKTVWEGNILYDAAALSKLGQCDCVLLVEQCLRSQYTQLSSAQELIEDHNKRSLGCVLIDG